MLIQLAPLRGVTDFVFRNTLYRHFKEIAGALAPFITTVRGKGVKLSHINDILPKNNPKVSVVPQLIGNEPQTFIVFANQLFDLGYQTINWNLGCPYPMIVRKKRGAGLLPHPELVENFLEKTLPNIKCKLSIKMRLGLDSPDEFLRVVPVLNNFPLTELILHPRTADQMYEGVPDLDGFEKFRALSAHPVVYNGDIIDLESFDRISRRFPGLDKIMIGRGLLMRPYLAEMIQGRLTDVPADTVTRLRRFHEDLLAGYASVITGQNHLLDKMKQLWGYLSFSLDNQQEVLKKIQRSKTFKSYREAVERAFNAS
jgi:tRNA-dihydrouridine synthase B